MKSLTILLVSMLVAVLSVDDGIAQNNAQDGRLLDVPVYPLTAIAKFGTGGWSEIRSKQGPAVLRELRDKTAPQVVIFSRVAGDSVFRLTKTVDDLVSNQDWGKWCALVICHQNNPTPTELDWNKQFAELQEKSKRAQLASISVGLWNRNPESRGLTRAHRRFDGFKGFDLVVFFRNSSQTTQYMERLNTEQLDDKTLDRVSSQLRGLLSTPPLKSSGKRTKTTD